LYSLTELAGEAATIQASLETIEESIDEYGAPTRIGSAVTRLREALDNLNEVIEEEENH
jgi:uncharacterized protein YukE